MCKLERPLGQEENDMTRIWSLSFAFLLGYAAANLAQEFHVPGIMQARAEVAGMGFKDLKADTDFKRAVKDVVSSSCYLNNNSIYC